MTTAVCGRQSGKTALVAGLLCACVFALLSRYFLRSDLAHLAVSIPDDSFYCFQPAWMFSQTGQFTADGLSPTYGFQPLWTVLLAGLACVTPDKAALLRAGLMLAALFYCATALLLYRLSREWWRGWKTLVAPAIWLLNPPLIEVYTAGKENALHAFLLVAVLILAHQLLQQKGRPANCVVFGVACGLLCLSRVNSVIVVALLALMLPWLVPGSAWERARGFGYAILGLGVVTVPWLVYSHVALGSMFPNSGTVKLLFTRPMLVLYLCRHIPFLHSEWFMRFLSPEGRLWLQVPHQVLPSVADIVRYLTRFVPGMALGFWKPCVLAVLIVALPSACAVLVRPVLRRAAVASLRLSLQTHLPVWLLLLYAIINTGANGLLLPQYLFWGNWYAVPEALAFVVLAAGVTVFAADSLFGFFRSVAGRTTFPARWSGPLRTWAAVVAAALLLAGPATRCWHDFRPKAYAPVPGWQEAAWEAHFWMNRNIPSGARVGAWGSGLVGYFADGPVVVNLDGLANSPEFAVTVYRDTLLYSHGLLPRNATWDYIQRKGITYAADWVYDADLGVRPFMGAIPVDHYKVVYRAPRVPDIGSVVRRYVVVKVR